MKVKVEVFTSPTCPHCPAAIRLARSVENAIPDIVKVVETSSGTHHGFKRMKKLNIMATPTIIISGPAIPDRIGFQGTPSREKFLKAIAEAYGVSYQHILDKVEGVEEPKDSGTTEISKESTEEQREDNHDNTEQAAQEERGFKKFLSKVLTLIKKKEVE